MPPTFGDLGELQLEIMKVLWNIGPATVHEVLGAMSKDPPAAYTTILTVLRNLEKRGLVQHEEIPTSRSFRYRAVVTEGDMIHSLLIDIADRLFDGSTLGLVVHILESEAFSVAEYSVIARVLRARAKSLTASDASLA